MGDETGSTTAWGIAKEKYYVRTLSGIDSGYGMAADVPTASSSLSGV